MSLLSDLPLRTLYWNTNSSHSPRLELRDILHSTMASTAYLGGRASILDAADAALEAAAESRDRARWAEGKVALVTGATMGIGYSIAERLGLSGAHVVICSRSQKNVDSAVESLRARGIKVTGLAIHVGSAEARAQLIQATVSAGCQIDILVSTVGVNPAAGPLFESTTESTWDKIMDINVKSHFFLVKECVPHMPAGGSVLLMSSYAGSLGYYRPSCCDLSASYVPMPYLGAYSVSKSAINSLTKVLAAELATKQIRVNCIAPGMIKTRFSELMWRSDESELGTGRSYERVHIPLGRYGEASEVGGVACFLCSDDASYITGETVVVAGGVMSRL